MNCRGRQGALRLRVCAFRQVISAPRGARLLPAAVSQEVSLRRGKAAAAFCLCVQCLRRFSGRRPRVLEQHRSSSSRALLFFSALPPTEALAPPPTPRRRSSSSLRPFLPAAEAVRRAEALLRIWEAAPRLPLLSPSQPERRGQGWFGVAEKAATDSVCRTPNTAPPSLAAAAVPSPTNPTTPFTTFTTPTRPRRTTRRCPTVAAVKGRLCSYDAAVEAQQEGRRAALLPTGGVLVLAVEELFLGVAEEGFRILGVCRVS